MNFSPIMKACAKPSGDGCSAYSNFTPNWLPSPESRLKPGKSKGVDIEYFTDTCQHPNRNRIIYHRFIEDWNQLFANSFSDWVQACTASSC